MALRISGGRRGNWWNVGSARGGGFFACEFLDGDDRVSVDVEEDMAGSPRGSNISNLDSWVLRLPDIGIFDDLNSIQMMQTI